MLSIDGLCVRRAGADCSILNDLSLSVGAGEVHAIMGPNGAGKSTLAQVLIGHSAYEVTQGSVLFNGEDLLLLEPHERACKGVFLAFQYPVELPGVPNMTFLKCALNAQRKSRGEKDIATPDFIRLVRQKAKELRLSEEMMKRAVNVGFSGGEKKRNEILQMAVLSPQLCIMDETDSGLDIDSMRDVAETINLLRNSKRSFIIITHYHRLLEYIDPDVVHVLVDGKVVLSGGHSLAVELEKTGYIRWLK